MPSPCELQLADLRRELGGMVPPEMPRPLPPVTDPRYQAWREKFQVYADRRDDLMRGLRVLGGDHATL